jgi:hypothetical protein
MADYIDGPYQTTPNRWYKAFPYGFAFWNSDATEGSKPTETFWLPIAPNNINITTHFATNVITTLYGIIEEHSEVRYYDITITGNTGIAPKYTTSFSSSSNLSDVGSAITPAGNQPANAANKTAPSIGRESFAPSGGLLSALGGFLPEVANTLNAAVGAVNKILGKETPNKTGITPEQSGYYAFHNFQKFLLRYKMDATGTLEAKKSLGTVFGLGAPKVRKMYPLQFLNYKDGIKYDVIPITFTLVRSAENPMLYTYSIKLRAFNLSSVESSNSSANSLMSDLGLGPLQGPKFLEAAGKVLKATTLTSALAGL